MDPLFGEWDLDQLVLSGTGQVQRLTAAGQSPTADIIGTLRRCPGGTKRAQDNARDICQAVPHLSSQRACPMRELRRQGMGTAQLFSTLALVVLNFLERKLSTTFLVFRQGKL